MSRIIILTFFAGLLAQAASFGQANDAAAGQPAVDLAVATWARFPTIICWAAGTFGNTITACSLGFCSTRTRAIPKHDGLVCLRILQEEQGPSQCNDWRDWHSL
jgi:hypothetical protein